MKRELKTASLYFKSTFVSLKHFQNNLSLFLVKMETVYPGNLY